MGLYNVYSTREFPLCLNCFFLPLLKYSVGILLMEDVKNYFLQTCQSFVNGGIYPSPLIEIEKVGVCLMDGEYFET